MATHMASQGGLKNDGRAFSQIECKFANRLGGVYTSAGEMASLRVCLRVCLQGLGSAVFVTELAAATPLLMATHMASQGGLRGG